jgi:hypothetical protein
MVWSISASVAGGHAAVAMGYHVMALQQAAMCAAQAAQQLFAEMQPWLMAAVGHVCCRVM